MKACVRLAVVVHLIAFSTVEVFGQMCSEPPVDQVSWWSGDGDAGDLLGGNGGTPAGNAGFATGLVGQAFSFDGTDGYIRVLNAPSLEITGDLTIEAWVNPESLALGQVATVVAKWGQSVVKDSYVLSLIGGEDEDENPIIQVIGAIGVEGVPDLDGVVGGALQPGVWCHVAMTYDSSDGKNIAYVDGLEVACRDRLGGVFDPNPANDVDLLIGRETDPPSAAGARQFSGLIDEVGIYDRVLSASELEAIFDAGSAGKCKLVVEIDIKPGSEQNCFNNNGNGVIPVAILGAVDFDVTEVDAESVELEGMGVKAVGKSNKLLATIQDVNGDDIDDLVVKIEDEDGVFEEGDTMARLTGALLPELGGTSFQGFDMICILGGGGGGGGAVSFSTPSFRRGDSNADRATNISDPLFTLDYLFSGGREPGCRDAADADDDGRLGVADAVYSLNALFGDDPVTVVSFGHCDLDWTEDALDCLVAEGCAAGD